MKTPANMTQKDPRWIAFGLRLVELRRLKNWRAMDVARLIEVDPATYSHLEHGDRKTGPERQTLENLATLYEMSVEDLLGEKKASPHAPIPRSPSAVDTVFPRAGSVPSPDLYAAVSEALYTILQDLLAGLGEARAARAAADAAREDRRAPPGSTRRTGRG